MAERRYCGDVTPKEAYAALAAEPGAALVDVRTEAEWAYVGSPDVTGTSAAFLRVEWQSYPSMDVNADFAGVVAAALEEAGCNRDSPVYFICRSGARSAAAAAALTAAGVSRCFNVAGGFEGRRDEAHHRGTVEGWKADSLPWTQS